MLGRVDDDRCELVDLDEMYADTGGRKGKSKVPRLGAKREKLIGILDAMAGLYG